MNKDKEAEKSRALNKNSSLNRSLAILSSKARLAANFDPLQVDQQVLAGCILVPSICLRSLRGSTPLHEP